MKNFKLNAMEQMLHCERVYQNENLSRKLRLPLDTVATEKSMKLNRDYFVKQFSDETENFIVSNRVIEKVFPEGIEDMDRDHFFKKKVVRDYLALPFGSMWIEGELKEGNKTKTQPLMGVPTKSGGLYLILGVLIHEHENSYYISCLMTNEVPRDEITRGINNLEPIHYSCIINHESVETGVFDTPEEEEFYIQMHVLLELVTKHKKLGYIHNNQSMKMNTPKGVKKVHVNRVIGVCLKEEGVKIINNMNSKFIEFSHQFPCMAHWRYYPNSPEFEGKDIKGNKNQLGRTWVKGCIKGRDKNKKKGQIRYVNEYERIHGKMDEVA